MAQRVLSVSSARQTMMKPIPVCIFLVASSALGQSLDEQQKRERCAVRLSVALTGKTPLPEWLGAVNPQDLADAMVARDEFNQRYARFINTQFNRSPGEREEEDAPFHQALYVLRYGLPWSDLFLAKTNIVRNSNDEVVVQADPNGLGYFRSDAWLKRYAGNEKAGIKLFTAYQMYNNTIGLKLVPSTNAPGADTSANGRQSTGCRGCHYDGNYPLDPTADVLSTRVTQTDGTITWGAQVAPQSTILGGITVHNDAELVSTLVNSEAFRFRTCRLAFTFLYGRKETTCEAGVFDRCMQDFRNQGTVQSAILAIVKDPSFCQ
jgi:hypothetical protein